MLLQEMLQYPTYSPDLTHAMFTSLDQLRKPSKAAHTTTFCISIVCLTSGIQNLTWLVQIHGFISASGIWFTVQN